MPRWREAALPGGLRVSLLHAPRFHAVRVTLYARVGSRHETAETAGLTHLLEHMLFRGSRGYPDQRRLLRALDSLGADYGAHTTQEFLEAGMTVHPTRLEPALEILHEIAFRPRFRDLEVEKRIITEEIRDDLDDADRLFALRSARLVWGPHPLGRPITGRSVRGFDRGDLRRHHRRWVVPPNLLLGIAGRFDPGETMRRLRRLDRPPAPRRPPPRPLPAPRPRGPRCRLIPRPTEKARVHLSFAMPHTDREEVLVVWVLSRLLGQRLMERVRDRQGLTYAISCEQTSLSDVLGLSIYTSVAPRNVPRVLTAVLAEVERSARRPVPLPELDRARAALEWTYDFLQDDLDQLADFYEFQTLFHPGEPPRSPLSIQSFVRRMTPSRILQTASRLLDGRHLAAVLMGDLEGDRFQEARRIVRQRAFRAPAPAGRS